MWNLSKIFKTTHYLMTTYGEDGLGAAENADFNGQHRLDHIVQPVRAARDKVHLAEAALAQLPTPGEVGAGHESPHAHDQRGLRPCR